MPVRAEEAYDELPIPTFTKTRDTSDQIHQYLRRLIIDEVLPSGSTLNQADLARRIGVSRIPMREAFRMLQQEGLIDVQLNQRATVRELSAEEVDNLYGTRIILESLAVRVTCGRLADAEIATAEGLLETMKQAASQGDGELWMSSHRAFHGICTARAEDPLSQLILSYSERTERYLRFAQKAHPQAFASAHSEHVAILDAVRRGDVMRGGALMGEHLSHTALIALGDLGDSSGGVTIREALAMSVGVPSASQLVQAR